MITEIKISNLYILSDVKGYVHPRIFISKEDAEKCQEVCKDLTILTSVFINS